ncbi:hypothetical protein HA402_005129 [Bradysia odoriphaga]|nr:hypothetical protein HA402_005129 [Bradysia odoriphaga]
MIVKWMLLILLVHLVRTKSQLDFDLAGSLAEKVGKIGKIASEVTNTTIYSAQHIAESLKGLIENFVDFKKIFNKNYTSEAEEKRRAKTFATTLEMISRHNELFRQLVDCAADDGKGCDGAFTYVVYEFARKKGIVSSGKYPYIGEESGRRNSCKKHKFGLKITGYRDIRQFDEEDLKDAVCRFGPVAAVISASSEKFQYLHNEVYSDPDCSDTVVSDLNHVVLVIGYGHDEETNEPYWLIKNSYGTSWGVNGFGRIARNLNNFCGIASLASYPVV